MREIKTGKKSCNEIVLQFLLSSIISSIITINIIIIFVITFIVPISWVKNKMDWLWDVSEDEEHTEWTCMKV